MPDFFSMGKFHISLSNSRKESLMHFDDSTTCRWPYNMSGACFLRNLEQICFVSLPAEEGGVLLVATTSSAAVLPSSSSFDLDLEDSIADSDERMPPLGGVSQLPPPSAIGNTRALIISRLDLLLCTLYNCCCSDETSHYRSRVRVSFCHDGVSAGCHVWRENNDSTKTLHPSPIPDLGGEEDPPPAARMMIVNRISPRRPPNRNATSSSSLCQLLKKTSR